jgi:hypothetical protein
MTQLNLSVRSTQFINQFYTVMSIRLFYYQSVSQDRALANIRTLLHRLAGRLGAGGTGDTLRGLSRTHCTSKFQMNVVLGAYRQVVLIR